MSDSTRSSAKRQIEAAVKRKSSIRDVAEKIIEPNWKNKTLFIGDNLHIMRRMNSSLMDLIATDPPFNSGRKFRAPIGDAGELEEVFKDYWHEEDLDQLEHALLAQYTNEMENLSLFSKTRYQGFNPLYSVITSSRAAHGKGMFTYLIMMAMRLIECRRLLKETGSIYLHCDASASHYLKMVMDAIFGKENFRREIIWRMGTTSGFKSKANNWIRDHDTILYYLKNHEANQTFNKQFFPYSKEYIEKNFTQIDENGRRYWDRKGRRRYYADEGG